MLKIKDFPRFEVSGLRSGNHVVSGNDRVRLVDEVKRCWRGNGGSCWFRSGLLL